MRSNPLDGPGMGYGPAAGSDRRGSPVVTVVLALVCLVLAGTLAFVLLRPTSGLTAAPVVTVTATPAAPSSAPRSPAAASPSVAGSATPSASPTAGGTDATERAEEPEGVRESATTFLRGWLERKKSVRVELLQVSTTDSLLDQLVDVDPAKIPKAKPKGALVVPSASDYAAVADQKMSDGTTVRMELVYEPASRYGWLVDTVGPLE
jgi:hypothetical protein